MVDAYGSNKFSVKYWMENRNSLDSLYPSEKKHLFDCVSNSLSTLDFGCACGGFYAITKEINPQIEYTGIDISEPLIHSARAKWPDGKFHLYDGQKLPSTLGVYDLVFSFGVLHHIVDWKDMVQRLLDHSRKYVLFDVRLTNQQSLVNTPTSV